MMRPLCSDMSRMQQLAWTSVLCAVAMALGWVESLIPFPIPIPGVKLGFANIAVLVALCTVGVRWAVAVACVKVLATSVLFGSLSMLAYSLSGTALALLVMVICLRFGAGVVPASILAAMAHNVGQMAAAVALLSTPAILSLLPVLMVTACVTGALTGLLAKAGLQGLQAYLQAA